MRTADTATQTVRPTNSKNVMRIITRWSSGLTTQAQRPGARDATIATATPPPGSLQRMVRHHSSIAEDELCHKCVTHRTEYPATKSPTESAARRLRESHTTESSERIARPAR